MESEEIKMAYLAGIMDGDGSFSIGRLSNGTAHDLYFPIMQCSKWLPQFIDMLKEEFGGNIQKIQSNHICKDGRKEHPKYHWRLRSGVNCRPSLIRLIPYLQIKRERAELLLNFIDENPFVRGQILSEAIMHARDRARLKMLNFNDWRFAERYVYGKVTKENSNDSKVWSYIAGIMDTDGSFSVKKQIKNKGTEVINPRYLPIISLSMTDTRAINFIRKNCVLGNLCIPRNKDTSSGCHYQFAIGSKKQAIEFLELIIPYLRAKKENALVLLDFCKNSENTKCCLFGVPPEELQFREECYQKLCALNKYGVYKPSLIDSKFLPGDAGDNEGQAAKACSLNVASEKAPEGDAVL